MSKMQPYYVFKAEVVRINELYWSSALAYDHTASILTMLSDTGQYSGDPSVDKLWGSKNYGMQRAATIPLSEYLKTLNKNYSSIRTVAILHICSAFENALCGYYALCCLYDGNKQNSNYTGANIPGLLSNVAGFESRRDEINKLYINHKAKPVLRGVYTQRLNAISDTWGFPRITTVHVTRLNGYYKKRHLIAHDQGLGAADSPEKSGTEILAGAISVTEAEWKTMIGDFLTVLEKLDELVASHVALDKGVALAIYRTIHRDGKMKIKELKQKLRDEWRLPSVKAIQIRKVAAALGLKTIPIDSSYDLIISAT
jgi:hypothetical protein